MSDDRDMNIRQEQPSDYREVENLTREAFWNVYRPGCTEHFVLNRFRENPDFIPELDLVMEHDGRIIGSGGAVLTGVADGVNLRTRVTSSETVSIPSEVYLDEEKDMLGTRLLSFGIPGCNPYDPASIEQSTSEHCLVLNVIYANSTYKNISVDLTDQFRELPLGGVIVLDLDVNDFPPESGETGGGGFDALITDWDEVVAGATITY